VPFFLILQCVRNTALSYTSIYNLILKRYHSIETAKIFCKYVYAVCTSRKFCKLECATRDESPTRLEVQQRLGTSLAQVLFDYSHQEAVKLLDSIPVKLSQQLCCASQDSQLKADAMGTWAKKQEILRSYLHSNILGIQWICVK